jgi:hypothetical protein
LFSLDVSGNADLIICKTREERFDREPRDRQNVNQISRPDRRTSDPPKVPGPLL